MPAWLRWVLLLPVAVGSTALVAIGMGLITYPVRHDPELAFASLLLGNLLGSYVLVRSGAAVAPTKKEVTAGILALGYGLLAIAFVVGALVTQGSMPQAVLNAVAALIGVTVATGQVAHSCKRLDSPTGKGVKAAAAILLITYTLPIPYLIPYRNWEYAREHGLLRWILFGEVVATVKAIGWPLSVACAAASPAELSQETQRRQ